MIRKFGFFLLLIFFAAGLGKGWHWAKDGFNINRVRSAFLSDSKDSLPESVTAHLSQSFFYLGQGRQYYAFESADGKYVLKLPRLDRYELPFWLRACPFPFLADYRKKVAEARKQRLAFLIESSQIAAEELKDQTGVLYLHFYKTEGRHVDKPEVQSFHYTKIKDRIGRIYWLDLDQTPFVLQEKKTLMASAFEDRLRKKDWEAAKEILESFLRLVAFRSEKGIFNKDYSYLKNYGFEGKKGYEIDIGSFYRKNSGEVCSKSALQETVEHLSPWLKEIDPELQKWFLCKAEEIQIE